MTYFIGTLLFLIAGYSLVRLLGLSRDHLFYDMSIGWFLGAGYYSLTWFILVYAAELPVRAEYSFLIILLPVLIFAIRSRPLLRSIIRSANNVWSTEYLPANRVLSLDTLLIIYSIVVFILIALHGATTPSNADDALHLRALTPMLAYDNNFTQAASRMIFSNGIWPTFVTVLFWHISGVVDHFYVNYTIITSLFFFLLVLYLGPAVRGNPRQGIYGVFLVLSIPLFVYQSTTTYADVRLAMPYALGFLFFIFYVRYRETSDLKALILFFTITCFVKGRGEIAGITGLSVATLFVAYTYLRTRSLPDARTIAFLIPVVLYLALKNYYAQNLPALADLAKSASWQMLSTSFLSGELTHADEYKIKGFFGSLFISGNFGIIFYVLLANILMNLRKILLSRAIWGLLFLGLVYMEISYYMIIRWQDIALHTAIVHRTVIVLSVMSALFLSSLWSRLASDE